MAKPVLITIDDDPEVLRSIERDLRREYGENFRVLRADSGQMALETLKKLKLRNHPVALLLVDQRMPNMTGVEFLEQAKEIFPDAKRALLTAYADTDEAIRAINKAKIDYYLMKPWTPPEQGLFPVLNDLLEIWKKTYLPCFEGVRVIGDRWSPKTHQIKDFLARNHIPYQWLDIESEEGNKLSSYTNPDHVNLPLLFFPDGSHLLQPTNIQIAEKIGLKTRAEMPFYDVIIVGAGPAGLAAAVYAASEGLHTVIVEKEAPGGQAGTSSRIENYLGFPVGLTGGDLARRAVAQAQKFGAEILTPQEVKGLRVDGQYRYITLADGSEISSHTVIIATGVSYRKLNVRGCDKLTGAGVYYGSAMTEAMGYQGEDVFIVGAGNSAGQAAIHLSRYARSVTLLVRRDSLKKSMSKYLIDQIKQTNNIIVKVLSEATEVFGKDKLEAITITNLLTNEVETLPACALFIFIGATPHTNWLQDIVERDPKGYIMTGPDVLHGQMYPKGWTLSRSPYLLETNIPGILAVGDVRYQSVKRVASAVGEGSIAIQFIHQYLSSL
ncbi:MAG: FAD-dependent oxidoreductase [Pelatocladus maniniholoensis HA4357-MV3]|jgi:thioredoxin reductase (NADPH)|uniref:FAD-dependent oxidoreductase n=1 Tax=Pelatocladus maniniholoensis HA4357-MV3 TaxID=1117104 RepID=A0A9E3H5L6_9NOST|nr:FAD-dependent oxidoreductase [Pelatocladus maniniholoensis HA4357-MV3]BAZ70794.1 thioredoxin reductase carrying response regulator receiver domain protein [Fischerella sp. NIES-4106]